MSWKKAKKRGTITLSLDEGRLTELIEKAGVEVDDMSFDDIEVDIVEMGKVYYAPATMFTKDGDPGDPEVYDENFPLDEGDEDKIESLLNGLFEAKIEMDEDVEYDDLLS